MRLKQSFKIYEVKTDKTKKKKKKDKWYIMDGYLNTFLQIIDRKVVKNQ